MSDALQMPATILVVDDDAVVRSVACRLLRRLGYEVLEAESAADALLIARDRAGRLDLLLTDVVMPGMSGWQLGALFRAEHPTLPVLFMSGYSEEESFVEGVELSQVRFLAKPFDMDALTDSVREALRAGGA